MHIGAGMSRPGLGARQPAGPAQQAAESGNVMGRLIRKLCRADGAVPPRYELAQVNVARLLAPFNDPLVADFVANLAPVYRAAEAAAGFVWRWPDGGAERRLQMFDDGSLVVNISVWASPAELLAFTYGPAHRPVLGRRLDWFARPGEPGTALWWVPAGHLPTVAEAEARLTLLRTRGATAEAFGLRDTFPAPGGSGPSHVEHALGVREGEDAPGPRRQSKESPIPGVFQRLAGKVTACWYWV